MEKKRYVHIVFVAILVLLISASVYIACGGMLFAFGNKTSIVSDDGIKWETIDGNSDYLTGSYIDAFGVPAISITKVESDGGSEEGVNVWQMFDRNFNTAWRSEATVADGKTVKLSVFFSDPYEIEGFIYQADRNSKGYFSNLKISYHDENAVEQDAFVDLGTLKSTSTSNIVHVTLKEKKKMTAIRLEWLETPKVERNCAAAKELIFLQPKNDNVQKVLDLFDDYAQLELKDTVNEPEIKNLRATLEQNKEGIASWDSFVDPLLNRASQILAKTLSADPLREMSTDPTAHNVIMRVGDIESYARGVMKFSTFGTNRQATGISATPSDTLIVYVDAKEGDPLPTLVTTQHWGSYGSWKSSTYTLYRGRNVIRPQNVYNYAFKDNTGDNIPIGGPVYLINPYLPAEEAKEGEKGRQSSEVKIYFEGGETFPIFREGDEEETYKNFLKEYADRVEQDRILNAETGAYKVLDLTEVVSDRVFVTVQASMANKLYNLQDYSPEKACDNWDHFVDMLLLSEGVVLMEDGETEDSDTFKKRLEEVGAKYDPRNEWLNVNIRLMQPFGAAYAAGDHVGIQVDWESAAITGGPGFGWGYAHEIGHELDIAERLVGECSNNMVSKFNETVLEKTATRGDFAVNTATLAPDNHIDSYWNTNRGNFTFWWLIESYFPGYWAKLENRYRYEDLYQYVRDEKGSENINATEKQIYLSSLVTGIDLSYYFERWGYNLAVSDKIFKGSTASSLFKQMMKAAKDKNLIKEISENELPKLWYLDAAEWWVRYSGENHGVLYDNNSTAPEITAITKSGKNYSLMIGEDENYNNANHLGYEIQVKVNNEWKVAGFTYGRMFSDTTDYDAEEYGENFVPTYRLVSYDRALKATQPGTQRTYSAEAITEVCKLVHEGEETTYNSISEAVSHAQDNDTIILLKNNFESGIVINKKLTIKTDGNSVTVTKSGSEPIFTIVEETEQQETEVPGEFIEIKHNGDLTLLGTEGNELIFDGYGIESDGSLIYVKSGTLKIEHCIFKRGMYKWGNNSAGGALRFDGGDLTVSNTTFSENSARLGGAVYIIHRNNSHISFTNCKFEKNSADEGAGFYNTSTITFKDCTFIENKAKNVGGGFANMSGGVLTIEDCTFQSNNADRGGGFYSDGKVELYGGNFTDNTAITEGAAFAYYRSVGGGRYFYSRISKTTSKNPSVSGNTCEKGSAVWIHGEVEEFVADICDNICKYALRVGGSSGSKICINGGKIKGGFFREGTGTVIVKALPEVDEKEIPVYSDAEEASYVLFAAESGELLSQEFADKFKAENQKTIKYDETRKSIVVELDSYSIHFSITVINEGDKSQIKHYRPGYEFVFESFSGDKNQQWYVKEWKDNDGKIYSVGSKYTVKGDTTFTAVIAQKYKIEFIVEDDIEGIKGQVFYAMPAERYTLPKYDVDGYIHNGWESRDVVNNEITKLYQPFSVLRAGSDRTFTAKIVRKFTVRYWVTKQGEQDLCFATKTYGFGSKIEGESYWEEPYITWGSFIEGFYIKYSNGEFSKDLINFDTFTISSDLELYAKIVDNAAIIYYSIYNDSDLVFSDLKSDNAAYNSIYSISLLPIPTGYHITKVNINYEDYMPDQINGMSFLVEETYYMIFIFIEKDTYTVSFECNEVPFRTETLAYGSTYTFTDPTKTLLKEAVRKFDGAGNYYFTSYQLVSPNPIADEEGQEDTIKVNVLLGTQITITTNITINIVAYIEGYEYTPQEDNGSELIEGWRADARRRANAIANEMITKVNDSAYRLGDKERAKYVEDIRNELKETLDVIAASTMLTSMNSAVDSFKFEIEKINESLLKDSEKNIAVEQVENAKKDAVEAFKNMDQDDEKVKEALGKIEEIANSAISSIRNATDLDILKELANKAKEDIQQIIVGYNGDQLLYQKNNAISMMRIASETAKRVINGLTYLSSQKKEFYVNEIETLLSEASDKVNAVTEIITVPMGRSIIAKRLMAIQSINDIRDEFIKKVTTTPAEGETSIPSQAKELNDKKAELAQDLEPYAEEAYAEIEEILAAGFAEIKNEGIILSIDEVTSSVTAFAEERRAYIATLLDSAISAIKEISEDGDDYATVIQTIVADTKTSINAERQSVVDDIIKNIKEAERKSRADLISINITAVADAVRMRLDELILNDKSNYLFLLEEASLTAEKVINEAENIGAINMAIKEFNDMVEKNIKLGSEKENANARIDKKVTDAALSLSTYGFLGEWNTTYNSQVKTKAANAKSNVTNATLSTEMINIFNTFSSAVDEILKNAKEMNAEKGLEVIASACNETERTINDRKAQIDELGFLSADEKETVKAEINELLNEIKEQLSAANSEEEINNRIKSFEVKVENKYSQAKSDNDATAQSKIEAAIAETQSAAAALKTKIGALSSLPSESKELFYNSIEETVKKWNDSIRKSTSEKLIEENLAAFKQALDTTETAAKQENDAKAGDELADARLQALKSLGEYVIELRASIQQKQFLGEDEKGKFNDFLTIKLDSATKAIEAAKSQEQVISLESQYKAEITNLGSEVESRERSAKEDAVAKAQSNGETFANEAKQAIDTLDYLTDKLVYKDAISSALETFSLMLKNVSSPEDIDEAMKIFVAAVSKQKTDAEAAALLSQAKADARDYIGEDKTDASTAISTINKLGFISEEEKEDFIKNIRTAISQAEAGIDNATTADIVAQVVSTFKAALDSQKNLATQLNSQNESAVKSESRETIFTAKTSALSFLDAMNFLTKEEKDSRALEITTLSQTTEQNIDNAKSNKDVKTELEKFNSSLSDITDNAQAANNEAETEKTEFAKSAVQNAGDSLKEELAALGFLGEELETYKTLVDKKVAAAIELIVAAVTIDGIEAENDNLKKELASVKADAEKRNVEIGETKKQQAREGLADKKDDLSNKLEALTALKDEEKEIYQTSVSNAIDKAITDILNAQDPLAIQAAETELDASLKNIIDEAKLRATKNGVLSDAKEKAEQAKAEVGKLGLEDEATYLTKIKIAFEEISERIEFAENEEDTAALVEEFEAKLATVITEAKADASDRDLADAKASARGEISKYAAEAHEFIAKLKFLTENERNSYQTQVRIALEDSEQSITNSFKTDNIAAIATALQSALSTIKEQAEAENTKKKTEIKATAKQDVNFQKNAADNAADNWGFMKETDKANYHDELQRALELVLKKIEDADTQESIDEAKGEFRSAMDVAGNKAISLNESARKEALLEANNTVNELAAAVKNDINALLFIVSSEYTARIDIMLEQTIAKIEEAADTTAIDEAIQVFISDKEMTKAEATNANNSARTNAIDNAKQIIIKVQNSANDEIRLITDITADGYISRIEKAVTNAEMALSSAENAEEIENIKNTALNEIEQALSDARNASLAALTGAKEAAKSEVESKKAEVLGKIGEMTYLGNNKSSYEQEIGKITQEALSKIDQAENIETAETAKTEAIASLENILSIAEAKNTLTSAIQKAKEAIEELYDFVIEFIQKLGFLRTKSAITMFAVSEFDETTREDFVARVDDLYNTALAKLEAEDFVDIDAVSQYQTEIIDGIIALREQANQINTDNETYTKSNQKAVVETAKQAALNEIDACKFLTDEEKENYKKQISDLYTDVFVSVEKAQTIGETENLSATFSTQASTVSQSAVDLDANKKKEILANAKAAVENMRKTIETLELTDEQLSHYNEQLNAALENAETSINNAEAFDDVNKAIEELTKTLEILKKNADKEAGKEEEELIQVVVSGITAKTKVYDGTQSVEFDVSQVVYRNAETGDEIDPEIAKFSLTVSGRLSEYGADRQVAIITSIELSVDPLESGKYVLSMVGQQAFVYVDVLKANLTVFVNKKGEICYNGFVQGENESVLQGTLKLDFLSNDDGTFTVTPSGISSDNYNILFISGIVRKQSDLTALWIVIVAISVICATFGCIILFRRKRQ